MANHNNEVDRHNREHEREAHRLEGQLREAKPALARLVAAIESGGASPTVMEAIQRRENEVNELQGAIDRARAQVQPRIAPRVKIDDYRTGPKSLFIGEVPHDKALVTQALSAIEVSRDGGLTIVFRPDSMFKLARRDVEPGRGPISHSIKDQRSVLQMHDRLPGAPTRVDERNGRITLLNDATNRVSDPNGN